MDFSLAPETLTGVDAKMFLRAASAARFRGVGLRVIEGSGQVGEGADVPALVRTPATVAEVHSILDGEGLTVTELEWVALDGRNAIETLRPGMEVGARFGARHLCAVCTDPDETRAAEHFAQLCELAGEHDLVVDIEFVPFTAVRTLDDAAKLIRRSGARNAGILFDIFHHFRGGGTQETLVEHQGLIRQVQLCDAPSATPESKGDRIRETLHARLLPGEGDADVAGAFENIIAETPFSLEVPHRQRLSTEGPVAYARRAHEAALQCWTRFSGSATN